MRNLTTLNEPLDELQRRASHEKMRRSLKVFTKRSWQAIEPGKEFYDNWHLDAVSEHLQAVVEGDIKRLIINIPPRHMKSISVAVARPA